MSKEDSNPAFPMPDSCDVGMTLRQYAAMLLGVADSGEPWLDEMIERSRRDTFAQSALNGLLARPGSSGTTKELTDMLAFTVAIAMIEATE